MATFTIEATYNLPCYRHTTYEAETLADAIAQAEADDNWNLSKLDYEGSGETRITGAWAGELPYSGQELTTSQPVMRLWSLEIIDAIHGDQSCIVRAGSQEQARELATSNGLFPEYLKPDVMITEVQTEGAPGVISRETAED